MDCLWVGPNSLSFTETAPKIVALAAEYSLLAGLGVGLVHLVRLAVCRIATNRLEMTASSLALAGLIALPCWGTVTHLTSGDWISSFGWIPALRVALTACVLIAAATIWLWHLDSVTGCLATGRSTRRALAVTAALTFAAGLIGLTHGLDNYTQLATRLAAPVWFIGSTLTFTIVARRHSPRKPVLIGAILCLLIAAGSIASSYLDDTNEQMAWRGRLTTLTVLSLQRSSPPSLRYDISSTETLVCRDEPAPRELSSWPAPIEKRRNVFLITLEAFRADMLGASAKGRKLTPRLDDFAAQSLDFERAHTTYPATLFAMGSALTGQTPSDILLSQELPDNVFSLTHGLGLSGLIFLPSSTWFRMPVIKRLFVQSASHFYDRKTKAQLRRVIKMLKQKRRMNRRIVSWIHLFDPHSPYKRHKKFDFGPGKRNGYLSEIAYTDSQAGKLLDYLEKDGWMDDSLVIVFANHGQALGEIKRFWGHHVYLTSWLTDIPLLLRGPGVKQGVRQDTVSIADVAPTVLHFLGQPVPGRMWGRSLMEKPEPDRHAVAEAFPLRGKELFRFAHKSFRGFAGLEKKLETVQHTVRSYSPKAAVIRGDLRLVVDRMTGNLELFDAKTDPRTMTDVLPARPGEGAELRRLLKQWHAKASARYACDAMVK